MPAELPAAIAATCASLVDLLQQQQQQQQEQPQQQQAEQHQKGPQQTRQHQKQQEQNHDIKQQQDQQTPAANLANLTQLAGCVEGGLPSDTYEFTSTLLDLIRTCIIVIGRDMFFNQSQTMQEPPVLPAVRLLLFLVRTPPHSLAAASKAWSYGSNSNSSCGIGRNRDFSNTGSGDGTSSSSRGICRNQDAASSSGSGDNGSSSRSCVATPFIPGTTAAAAAATAASAASAGKAAAAGGGKVPDSLSAIAQHQKLLCSCHHLLPDICSSFKSYLDDPNVGAAAAAAVTAEVASGAAGAASGAAAEMAAEVVSCTDKLLSSQHMLQLLLVNLALAAQELHGVLGGRAAVGAPAPLGAGERRAIKQQEQDEEQGLQQQQEQVRAQRRQEQGEEQQQQGKEPYRRDGDQEELAVPAYHEGLFAALRLPADHNGGVAWEGKRGLGGGCTGRGSLSAPAAAAGGDKGLRVTNAAALKEAKRRAVAAQQALHLQWSLRVDASRNVAQACFRTYDASVTAGVLLVLIELHMLASSYSGLAEMVSLMHMVYLGWHTGEGLGEEEKGGGEEGGFEAACEIAGAAAAGGGANGVVAGTTARAATVAAGGGGGATGVLAATAVRAAATAGGGGDPDGAVAGTAARAAAAAAAAAATGGEVGRERGASAGMCKGAAVAGEAPPAAVAAAAGTGGCEGVECKVLEPMLHQLSVLVLSAVARSKHSRKQQEAIEAAGAAGKAAAEAGDHDRLWECCKESPIYQLGMMTRTFAQTLFDMIAHSEYVVIKQCT